MTQDPDAPTADDERPSLGQEIITWIESNCRVPEGALIGQPIQLMPWQRDAILKTYDNVHGTRRCIISVGRKSGKTTFAACLLLVHLVGPAAIPNSQLYSAAQSRDQAGLLFALAAKICRMSPRLSDAIICRDGTKQLHCPAKGTLYRALSADASTAYGAVARARNCTRPLRPRPRGSLRPSRSSFRRRRVPMPTYLVF